MKKIVVALAAVLACSSAFAAEAQSEFFHQAVPGSSEGTIGLNWQLAGKFQDDDTTGQQVYAMYEYAFNDMLSLSAMLSYSQYKVEQAGGDVDMNGLNNLLLALRGKHNLGTGLRYGAWLSVGLEKGEVKANGDMNVADGGIMLTPYVGYEWTMDNNMFGGRVSYDVQIGKRKIDQAGTDIDVEGGQATTVAAYFEHMMNEKYTLGASVDYSMVSKYKPEGGGDVDAANLTKVTVYAPIRMVGPGQLIPSISMQSSSGADAGALNDMEATTVGVKYRLMY